MKTIAKESFLREGKYPRYTLALVPFMKADYTEGELPVVLCQYTADDLQAFAFQSEDAARTCFRTLCGIPDADPDAVEPPA